LQNQFKKYGPIERCSIPTRPDGTSKGIGFIEFKNAKDAQKAINGENGKEMEGRNLNIRYSDEKPPERAFGGNQGGFRGGNGGGADGG
jgi:RNA recognition motif-containing protein